MPMIKPLLPPRALVVLAAYVFASNAAQSADQTNLSNALTFHASFDGSTEAEFALGDAKLYHAPAMNKRTNALPGLSTNGIVTATKQNPLKIPIVIRLTGTNEEIALKILTENGFEALTDMDEAVKKAVELATNGGKAA